MELNKVIEQKLVTETEFKKMMEKNENFIIKTNYEINNLNEKIDIFNKKE